MDTDANQWAYTSLPKQRWIPDANQWTYTNILKQRETRIPDANQWTYTSLLPHHRKQLPINGLMFASSMDKTQCHKVMNNDYEMIYK